MNSTSFQLPGRQHALAVAAALAVTVSLSLSACVSGPDYQAPAIATGDFSQAGLLAQRNAATPMPALDQWWQGFNDPLLNQIVTRALAQNLDLAAALARVQQARAAAQFAGAQQLPQGSLNTQAARQKQSLQSPLGEVAHNFPGYERTQTLYDAGIGASWELDLAGNLRRSAEAADAEYAAAEAEHAGVRISIVAEAADAYFRIRGAQARLQLAQQQIETSAHLQSLVQLRLHGGLASQRDNALADAQLAQAKAALAPLQVELGQQLNRLDVLMGAAPGTYAQELQTSTPALTAVPQLNVADGTAALLRRRPDVLAAERRLAASNARIGVAVSEYYPSVSLSALLGFESLGTAGLFSSDSLQPQAVLGLRWRLFDFGRVDAEVARAKGVQQEALARYRQSVLHATEDVENALIALVRTEQQQQALRVEVDARVQARNNSEAAYLDGALALSDVLEDDRLLLQSRDQLVLAQAGDARAAVAAFRALGGGW